LPLLQEVVAAIDGDVDALLEVGLVGGLRCARRRRLRVLRRTRSERGDDEQGRARRHFGGSGSGSLPPGTKSSSVSFTPVSIVRVSASAKRLPSSSTSRRNAKR